MRCINATAEYMALAVTTQDADEAINAEQFAVGYDMLRLGMNRAEKFAAQGVLGARELYEAWRAVYVGRTGVCMGHWPLWDGLMRNLRK